MTTHVHGTKDYQVVVNDVTGTMAGSRPWSWITVTPLLVVLVFVALVYANRR